MAYLAPHGLVAVITRCVQSVTLNVFVASHVSDCGNDWHALVEAEVCHALLMPAVPSRQLEDQAIMHTAFMSNC